MYATSWRDLYPGLSPGIPDQVSWNQWKQWTHKKTENKTQWTNKQTDTPVNKDNKTEYRRCIPGECTQPEFTDKVSTDNQTRWAVTSEHRQQDTDNLYQVNTDNQVYQTSWAVNSEHRQKDKRTPRPGERWQPDKLYKTRKPIFQNSVSTESLSTTICTFHWDRS